MARPDPQSKPRGAAPAAVLASMSSIRRVAARPGDRYPVACLDAAGRLVHAPMEWYRFRAARNEPRSTSDTYLKHLLPALSDFSEQGVLWNDRPEVVRDAFVDFLSRKLQRVQRDKPDGERYALTAATPVSTSTVNVLRAAVMNFYEIMAEKTVGLYRYKNPMTFEVLQALNRVRDGHPYLEVIDWKSGGGRGVNLLQQVALRIVTRYAFGHEAEYIVNTSAFVEQRRSHAIVRDDATCRQTWRTIKGLVTAI